LLLFSEGSSIYCD